MTTVNQPAPPPTSAVTDAELRAARNAVFPAQTENQIQDDASWEYCKPIWREDEKWLMEQYRKLGFNPAKHESNPCSGRLP